MYLMRLVYECKRGKTSDVVECLKILNQVYTQDGCTHGKIYVDRMGRMDRAVFDSRSRAWISSMRGSGSDTRTSARLVSSWSRA